MKSLFKSRRKSAKTNQKGSNRLDNEKFQTFMYFLIKDAAKYDFTEFLEESGLTKKDYDEIKTELESRYDIKLYL